MEWPISFPDEMSNGCVSLHPYDTVDAEGLFVALGDERAWEHIPRAIPLSAAALDALIQLKLNDGLRKTFVIDFDERIVGMTSVLLNPTDPAGVEVGGTQLDPAVWGTGVNKQAKGLLFAAVFAAGAEWILLRTDERNARSAAAIRRLGARALGVHQDSRVRRDGTRRRSLLFRVERPVPNT